MNQKIKRFDKLQNSLDYIFDWNPQFLREIKGKLKLKKIIATAAAAVFTQLFIVISFLGRLPDNDLELVSYNKHSRDCTGALKEAYSDSYDSALCYQDMHSHWIINWQLFWFDIFVTLSIIGTALLLVLGTFLLVKNIVAEQKKGTLNLVRISPQSASNILLGKILGVPILLYFFIVLAIPLHTVAALKAGIPLHLYIAFDLAIIASCGFFYSLGLLLSFVIPKSINAWVCAIAITLFISFSSILNTYRYVFNTTILDWLFIFNPNNLILYLGKATGIAYHHFNYFNYTDILSYNPGKSNIVESIFLSDLLFYGQALWQNIALGISLVIANYCLWTYWIWQGLKRRFYNPENTIISKKQSYWITAYFVFIALGFSLQDKTLNSYESIGLLQFAIFIFLLCLTFALTPQRQTLHDWARYRHQMKKDGNILWRELILGEKSPSTVAVAINALIATLYIAPAYLFFFYEDKAPSCVFSPYESIAVVLGDLIFSMSIIILFSAIAQLILLCRGKHKVAQALITTISLSLSLPFFIKITDIFIHDYPVAWLLSSFPLGTINNITLSTLFMATVGQWIAITLVSLQITRKLRQAGRSQTYKIVNGK